MRGALALLPLFLLVACDRQQGVELALMGPYREPNDKCRWVHPTPDTAALVQEGRDVVACPSDYEDLAVFISDVDATEIARMGGWNLYRVSRPWRG